MTTSNSLCLGFFLLVLCLTHGPWSGSARSIDSNEFELALSESKRQLTEESNLDSEPVPGGMLDDVSVQETSTQPLEVVQGSAPAPSQLGDVDQVEWCWPSCGHRAMPPSAPANVPTCQPACSYPQPGCQQGYFPPQPSQGCQQGYFPPQPSQGCQQGYPAPQPSPACQQGYPECQQGYPPQPCHSCQQGYYPPVPDCVTTGCQQGYYPPQTSPGCVNTGCQQGYYPPQTNPGCANPECQPTQVCTNPECQPAHSLPAPATGCASPECQTIGYPPQVMNNPPWPETMNPELPEPFYPPQASPSDASPGNGPRVTDASTV